MGASWLADLTGPEVQLAGLFVGQRKTLNFTGAVTVTDDEGNGRVNINIGGGAGGAVGSGLDGQIYATVASIAGWNSAAGDWNGGLTVNKVVGLTGTAGVVAMHGNTILWDAAGSPQITQADNTTGNGHTTTIQAQNSTFTNGSGGHVEIRGGTKDGTGIAGGVRLFTGTAAMLLQVTSVTGVAGVVGLCWPGAITATDHPANAGDRVINMCVGTAPTVNPGANGGIMWNGAGAQSWRGPNGTVTVVAPS